MKQVTIERMSARDERQRIAEHFDAGAPCPLIIKDAAADWPARGKWTLDFFASHYGSQVGIAPPAFGVQPTSGKATLLGAFIRHLDGSYAQIPGIPISPGTKSPASDDAPGWSFLWEAFQNNPEFFEDVSPFPSAIPNLAVRLPRETYDALESIHGRQLTTIYISRRNTITRLHRDWGHTFGCLVQFQGRKRVFLFPPGSHEPSDEAQFDPENPDFERYPAMRDVSSWTAVLEPFEMLIIPPEWLHYTRSEDHSVTMSHNFFNRTNFRAYADFLRDDLARCGGDLAVVDRLTALLDG